MITVKNNTFTITTADTSYVMSVTHGKTVENLHYGNRITTHFGANDEGLLQQSDITVDDGTVDALKEKYNNPYGNTINPEGQTLTLDNICLEFSNAGTGDYRTLPLILRRPDGVISTRFEYVDSFVYEGLYKDREKTGMPYAHESEFAPSGNMARTMTLELIYKNNVNDSDMEGELSLHLVYTAFYDCNVITRRTVLHNDTNVTYDIENISSLMLDLPGTDYVLKTFDGAWTRERHAHDKPLISGIYESGSVSGISGSAHNPFIMISDIDATEDAGSVYAFNLIYSGNHRETVEVSEYGKIRILTGIGGAGFRYRLGPSAVFYSPEAVLTYSDKGYNGASANMHKFVTDHIIPPRFAKAMRPVLINNWEATYFDFNRRKLLNLAQTAAKLGMELFVLDDGWFGERSDDTSSLGDWFVNERKLGGSLRSLVDDIKSLGLKFGIWVEPEMISKKSRLYEAHPEWAVEIPGMESYPGRNQYILDYTNPAVRDYIVDTLSDLFNSADISYVKWDMNRPLTDSYSNGGTYPGEFCHRYVMGLYNVLGRLKIAFPDILFEGCSAGGGRFDLGILSFMPQIWTSDDTDPNERIMIQGGTSYGYPPSTMGAHVSASPNHQTLRETPLETRFDVAAMGVLGYELDLTSLSKIERKMIEDQVKFYKDNRLTLQTGEFRRVYNRRGKVIWQIASEDRAHAVALMYRRYSEPNKSDDILYAKDLIEDAVYKVKVRETKIPIRAFGNLINQVSPIRIKEDGLMQALIGKSYAMDSETEEYTVTGATLMHAGIRLNQRFIGTGLNKNTRVMGDYSARLYTIDRIPH